MIDYGYNQVEISWGDAYMDAAGVTKTCKAIADLGGSRIRLSIQLGTFTDLDRAVNTACTFGLKPLMCIMNNPQFGYDGTPAGYGAQCKAIALRYGPSGTNQVTEYELFNEANNSLNPPGGAAAPRFVQFLKTGYTAIKSVHTSSIVIAGGTQPAPDIAIPFIGGTINPDEWYQGLYANGAQNFMDALGFHLYAETTPTPSIPQWQYLTGLRTLMIAQGDAAKSVWITEVGVGGPGAPGVTDRVVQRDWFKALIEGVESYPWCGPFYVFDLKNYSGGDTGGGSYGMLDTNFVPIQPIYDYAKTINSGIAPGPPSAPTMMTVSSITTTTAFVSWLPGFSTRGISGGRVYLSDGTKVADTTDSSAVINGLSGGSPYAVYATTVDAAGVESLPSASVPFTTSAPEGGGVQSFNSYVFVGSTLPPGFSQIGLGFTVRGGVALPVPPTTDGSYCTAAPFTANQSSPDHSSEIQQSIASSYVDRAALTRVRGSADGSQFMGAAVFGGGQADACQLFMVSGGIGEVVEAADAAPLATTDFLGLSAVGNVYTVYRIALGNVITELLQWVDVNGIYPGVANLHAGIGWMHLMVGGIYYPPPGITGLWRGTDLNPIQSSGGLTDVWHLVIAEEEDWDLVIGTDIWKAAL